MKIYLASSWKNTVYGRVLSLLRACGYEVYDFRDPVDGNGTFNWEGIVDMSKGGVFPARTNIELLGTMPVYNGFMRDFDAMRAADCCVLLLPCGRSAHLEAGYFKGAGKGLIVALTEPQGPDLMYKMADCVVDCEDNDYSGLVEAVRSYYTDWKMKKISKSRVA